MLEEQIGKWWTPGLPVDIQQEMTTSVMEVVLKMAKEYSYPKALVLAAHMALERLQRARLSSRPSRKGIGRAGAKEIIRIDWISVVALSSREIQEIWGARKLTMPDLQQLEAPHRRWIGSVLRAQ